MRFAANALCYKFQSQSNEESGMSQRGFQFPLFAMSYLRLLAIACSRSKGYSDKKLSQDFACPAAL